MSTHVGTHSTPLALLDQVASEAAARAPELDDGRADVRDGLRRLGDAGLLALGTPDGAGTVADQSAVIRRLAQGCLATAFSTWAQRMTVEYVAGWAGQQLRGEALDGLVAGTLTGATAMAPAFQAALGLRDLPVTAREDGDDLVLNGKIPWASNLFDDTVAVLPVEAADGRRLIVAIRTDLPGVRLDPHPPLLALTSTASTSVALEQVRISSSWVLTDRFLDLLADVRGTFLLLQTAFCLGLADAAIDAADRDYAGALTALRGDRDELVAGRDALDVEHTQLLARGGRADQAVVRLRLRAAQLAVDATRHEADVRGGAGYLTTSPTARRLREAAFLPIQSPTEAQLRWELSRSG